VPLAAVTTSFALIGVLVVQRDRSAVALLAVVVFVTFLAYRGYVRQSQGHAQVESLYAFTRALDGSVDSDAVIRTLLAQVRDQLRAEIAEILIRDRDRHSWTRTRMTRTGEIESGPVGEPAAADAWWAPAGQGQPVLLAGIQVGTIKRIEFNQRGYLDVSLDVNRDYQIPDGTTASVQQVSLFGDKAVALTPPPRPTGRFIAPHDTVPAGKPAASIDDLIARFDTVSRTVSDMTDRLRIEFVQTGGITDLRRTVASMNRLAAELNDVTAVQSRNLTATMASLRRTLSYVDSATVDSTVRNLRATSERVAALTGDLQQTSARLSGVLAKLERGDGSAAKLLNDPGLYNDVRALLMQVDSVMADLKRNPRKYINLKIF
jgi:phospholipid/cholesterol/gamma-HCH transport system substrate-binding protein